MDITLIKLSLIDEDKDQPRYQFSQDALEELANSIKEIGLLSPIKVRDTGDGRYKIIYGNRRYKASQMIGLESIPCIVSDATDEMDIYFEQIAENLTREDFSPIEEAEAFHKLMNEDGFRSSIKLLSSKLGKPESYIKNKLELLKFGSAVKKLIVSGTQIRKDCLTEDQLMPLKDLPIEFRDSLALTAARDELPVSDVKKIAKLFKDKSISDATKQKLLLKTGSGLIETWSVFEQNRKEKLAREKQQQEEARLAAERKAAQVAALEAEQEASAFTTKEHAESSGAQYGEATATAAATPITQNTHLQLEGNYIGAVEADDALLPSKTMHAVSLDKANYSITLDHAYAEAEALLVQLRNGDMQQLDACEQLSNDMLIKLQQLQELWRTIMRESQA